MVFNLSFEPAPGLVLPSIDGQTPVQVRGENGQSIDRVPQLDKERLLNDPATQRFFDALEKVQQGRSESNPQTQDLPRVADALKTSLSDTGAVPGADNDTNRGGDVMPVTGSQLPPENALSVGHTEIASVYEPALGIEVPRMAEAGLHGSGIEISAVAGGFEPSALTARPGVTSTASGVQPTQTLLSSAERTTASPATLTGQDASTNNGQLRTPLSISELPQNSRSALDLQNAGANLLEPLRNLRVGQPAAVRTNADRTEKLLPAQNPSVQQNQGATGSRVPEIPQPVLPQQLSTQSLATQSLSIGGPGGRVEPALRIPASHDTAVQQTPGSPLVVRATGVDAQSAALSQSPPGRHEEVAMIERGMYNGSPRLEGERQQSPVNLIQQSALTTAAGGERSGQEALAAGYSQPGVREEWVRRELGPFPALRQTNGDVSREQVAINNSAARSVSDIASLLQNIPGSDLTGKGIVHDAEHARSAVIGRTDSLPASSLASSPAPLPGSSPGRAGVSDMTNAVFTQMQKAITRQVVQSGSLSLSLSPSHLGNLDIRFRQDQGELNISVVVREPATRELLETVAPRLRASLSELGLPVQEIEVRDQEEERAYKQAGTGTQEHNQAPEREQPDDPSQQDLEGAGNQVTNRSIDPAGIHILV